MSAPSCPLCSSQSTEYRRSRWEQIPGDDAPSPVDDFHCWSCGEIFSLPVSLVRQDYPTPYEKSDYYDLAESDEAAARDPELFDEWRIDHFQEDHDDES